MLRSSASVLGFRPLRKPFVLWVTLPEGLEIWKMTIKCIYALHVHNLEVLSSAFGGTSYVGDVGTLRWEPQIFRTGADWKDLVSNPSHNLGWIG